MIIDDYNVWSGCKSAVDEYFENKQNEFKLINNEKLIITKC